MLAAAVTLAAAGAAHAQVTGNPTRGQQLWANPGAGLPACETCHSTATPPMVTGFPSLATMRNSLGAMTTTNAKQKTIAAIAGTPLMAAYRGNVSNGTALSDTDLNDIAAYIFPPSATPAPAPAPTPTPTPAPAPTPTPAPPPGAPVVSATPTIIGFPSTSVGAVSARQEIVVTNGTTAAVQFGPNAVMLMPIPGTNPPQAPAGATDFQLATAAAGTAATCQSNGVLQPGATCRIGVLFRPTGSPGFRSATWSVTFANATAQQVTLSGTATAPAPAPAPTPSPAPAASGTSSSRSGTSNVGAGGGAVDPLGLLLGGALLTAAAGLRRRK
jgi:cytochrome c553